MHLYNENNLRLGLYRFQNLKHFFAMTLLIGLASYQPVMAHGDISAKARKYLNAVTNEPNNFHKRFQFAKALLAIGERGHALEQFDLLSKSSSDLPRLNYYGASTALENNQLDKAKQYIEKQLAITPSDHRALSLSGHIHMRLENFNESARLFQAALEKQPRPMTDLYLYASEALEKSGDRSKALQTIYRGIEKAGQSPLLVSKAIAMEVELNHYQTAIELAERMQRQSEHATHWLILIGDLYLKAGNKDAAKKYYLDARAHFRKQPIYVRNRPAFRRIENDIAEKVQSL